MIRAALALIAALALPALAAQAQGVDPCLGTPCKVSYTAPAVAAPTPEQMLGETEALIKAERWDEARAMLVTLATVPTLRFETRFLTGYVAAATGDHRAAIRAYKAILSDDPRQTRVRLELAKSMLALGRTRSADRQYRIAEQDKELPPEVARTIRGVRELLRADKMWRIDMDFGIAPDTNINNATAADSVTILLGQFQLPLLLNDDARAKSGLGQTGSLSATVRFPLAQKIAVIADVDTTGTNYRGSDYDDYQAQAALGPEFQPLDGASISIQGLAAQRWYGGRAVSRQYGVKAAGQMLIGQRQRIGFQVDARSTNATFDASYDGWQVGVYASYERAVAKAVVASVGGFARRDWLRADAYSSTEVGATLGIGGELPLGINFGLSGTVSRVRYDAAIPIFSPDPRADWRLTARATLGNRKISVLGFSPQVSVTVSRASSTIDYFSTDRVKVKLALARYF